MNKGNRHSDLIVIGGGAAGFFCALRAADTAPGATITLLEGSAGTLNKVRISGGGRCNLTHACWDPAELVLHYPRGQRELLGPFHKFAPGDTIEWFEQRGVETKIEEDGRMFPVSDRSESVAVCLEEGARSAGINVRLKERVQAIARSNDGFQLTTTSGSVWTSDYLMIATGSQPKMWDLLGKLGHEIIPPVPSLFTFHISNRGLQKLSGVSVPSAKIMEEKSGIQTEGPLLITHQGLSGPAALRLSAWGAREFHQRGYLASLRVDWTGRGQDWSDHFIQEARTQSGAKQVSGKGQVDLPYRLWQWLVARSGIAESSRWADLTGEQMDSLRNNLSSCQLKMVGKSTFKEEFVTAGGVALTDIDFRTFGSRKVPNLFLAGEVLNIDAITGGFNFQAAWTGGWLAGSEIGERMGKE